MSVAQVIEADWSLVEGEGGPRLTRGAQVEVCADGRIARVGALGLRATRREAGRLLLPGFVNAHSHAFQRGLRGRTERFAPAGEGRAESPSFWTWRGQMYGLVERLGVEETHALSLRCFREMLAAGITTVGEFHYLHHDRDAGGFALDAAVVRAAQDAGIRLVLLYAYYNTGSIGGPLAGGQKRFAVRSVREYWDRVDAAASTLKGPLQTMGSVAHSVRAASLADIEAIYEESRRRGMPFHMHVEEQRREIEECVEAYGAPPMSMLTERLAIDERFTAVHCTHTDPGDMERFLSAGGNVCLCPITEANLGDGVADVPGVLNDAGWICVGTDSNSRLSFLEELRWLEYAQRLEREARGVVTDEQGSCAGALLRIGTANGAKALGVKTGAIEVGRWADFCLVDLTHPSLEGWDESSLLDALVFGGGDGAIVGTCVGGRWVGS